MRVIGLRATSVANACACCRTSFIALPSKFAGLGPKETLTKTGSTNRSGSVCDHHEQDDTAPDLIASYLPSEHGNVVPTAVEVLSMLQPLLSLPVSSKPLTRNLRVLVESEAVKYRHTISAGLAAEPWPSTGSGPPRPGTCRWLPSCGCRRTRPTSGPTGLAGAPMSRHAPSAVWSTATG